MPRATRKGFVLSTTTTFPPEILRSFHKVSRRPSPGARARAGLRGAWRRWLDVRRRERAERMALLARIDSLQARVDGLTADVAVLQAKTFGPARGVVGMCSRGNRVAGN